MIDFLQVGQIRIIVFALFKMHDFYLTAQINDLC